MNLTINQIRRFVAAFFLAFSALALLLAGPVSAQEEQGTQVGTPIADALSASEAVSTETASESYFALGEKVVVDVENINIGEEIDRLVTAVCGAHGCDLKDVLKSTQEEQARALLAAQTAIIEARSAAAVAKAEAILAEAEAFRDALALKAAVAANALAKEVGTVVPVKELNAALDELAVAEAAIAAEESADAAAERQAEIDALNTRIAELEAQTDVEAEEDAPTREAMKAWCSVPGNKQTTICGILGY